MNNWAISLLITAGYTVVALVIGLKSKGSLDMSKLENWGVGGRTMGIFVTFFLIGAGNISAYTFMGGPGWAFSEGVPVFYVTIYLLYMCYQEYFVGARAWKLSKEHGFLTQSHCFGERYNSRYVRALSSFVTSIGLLFYAVIQIKACGYILNVVSGGNVPIWLGEVVVTTVIFIYLYTSGLRAVGWTNALQGVFMMITAFGLAVIISYKYSGSIWPSEIFEKISDVSPEHLLLPGNSGSWTPLYWTTSVIGSLLAYWPTSWLWATGTKSVSTIRRTANILPIFYFVMLPMIFIGFAAIIVMPNYVGKTDLVALTLASQAVPAVFVGIIGAAMLAASQSSSEPMFQACAFTYTFDILGPLFKLSEYKQGKIQRLLLIPIMFLVVLPLALLNPASLVALLLIGYAFIGQTFPLIIGTVFWPRSNKYGALAGLFAGTVVVGLFTWVWIDAFGIFSGMWGLFVNIPIHIIISLATKPEPKTTIQKFFSKDIIDILYVDEGMNNCKK